MDNSIQVQYFNVLRCSKPISPFENKKKNYLFAITCATSSNIAPMVRMLKLKAHRSVLTLEAYLGLLMLVSS